jgi:hypothetical protein
MGLHYNEKIMIINDESDALSFAYKITKIGTLKENWNYYVFANGKYLLAKMNIIKNQYLFKLNFETCDFLICSNKQLFTCSINKEEILNCEQIIENILKNKKILILCDASLFRLPEFIQIDNKFWIKIISCNKLNISEDVYELEIIEGERCYTLIGNSIMVFVEKYKNK